jgi:hypothetical protein
VVGLREVLGGARRVFLGKYSVNQGVVGPG